VGLERERNGGVIGRDGENGGAGLAQESVGCAAGIEGAQQVDIDHGFKSVGRHAGDGRGEVSGRGAQEDVDFAELLARAVERGFEGGVIADVQGGGLGNAARGADGCGGRIQPLLLPSGHDDRCSVFGEALRHALPDSASSAGDECHLALQQIRPKDAFHDGAE